MSFSQKHTGKVLVPWFNKYEWKLVYDYIHSDDKESQLKALEILQIWKMRMPLLSAGVEGSLIILEALLIDRSVISESQLNQIYSLAFLRFLNVCATNSERQGTFYKTAIENELPKWMISFRHDIAHSHKLPSLSILELCLNNCLKWLKEKYWKNQVHSINDYVHGVKDTAKDNRKVLKVLSAYLQVNFACVKRRKINYETKEILEELNIEIDGKEDILQKLRKLLRHEFRQRFNDDVKKDITKLLVSEDYLLSGYWNFDKNRRNLISLWNELLEILLENNLLSDLLNALLETINNNIENKDLSMEIASSWIHEIFLGLYNSKKIKQEIEEMLIDKEMTENGVDTEFVKKYFIFNPNLDFPQNTSEDFLKRILTHPNKYTSKFIQIILLYNRPSNENLSKNILKIVDIKNNSISLKIQNELTNDTIYTVNNLIEELNYNFSNDISDCNIDNNLHDTKIREGEIFRSIETDPFKGSWKVVKNTAIFKECPLGILPNQRRDLNPQLLQNML